MPQKGFIPVDEDVYFKKTVTFNAWKHSLRFRVSQELFSSHDIDTGTRFLLRSVVEAGYSGLRTALDLGCGYGPIGLTLKNLYQDLAVDMIDRDALAVEYSLQNAELNKLKDIDIYGSLGYDDVKRTNYDLVIANIPGKAGEPVLGHLLTEAARYLAPGGTVAIVVVKPLAEPVTGILENTPGIDIILRRTRSEHTVFHYRFSGEPRFPETSQSSLERGIYHRKSVKIRTGKLEFSMQTAYGLPEFDTLGYLSEMVIKALPQIKSSSVRLAAVLNPGQGHTAVAVWKLLQPAGIALIDRDLLALRYSQLNLALNGCLPQPVAVSHQVGIDLKRAEQVDLFVIMLREEEGNRANILTLQQAAGQLSANGIIMIAANSTAITRLVAGLESQRLLKVQSRERWRGNSLLILRHS